MTKLLRDAISQVEQLPDGEQDAAAVAMLDYLAHRQSLRVSDEDLAEIRRRRADPDRKLVGHEEARARIKRLGASRFFDEKALAELEGIYNWIAKENPVAAKAVVERLFSSTEHLARFRRWDMPGGTRARLNGWSRGCRILLCMKFMPTATR